MSNHPGPPDRDLKSIPDQDDPDLEDLLAFIRDSRGFDFTGYKRSTLTRRIRKRMSEACVPTFVDYRDVAENPSWPIRKILDELVMIEQGLYLGQALMEFRGSQHRSTFEQNTG